MIFLLKEVVIDNWIYSSVHFVYFFEELLSLDPIIAQHDVVGKEYFSKILLILGRTVYIYTDL